MEKRKGMYEKYLKRPLDFICALLGLIILSPVMLIVWILVRLKLGSPVIFRQKRPGLNERIFTLYKFRTMVDQKDKNGKVLPDEVRLTKFGKWLRSTSMDELPELVNILKGDMSVVGPRPLLVEYLSRYNCEQKKRHFVKPGITGLAQVNGRNSITWEEKFKLDVEYVNHINFLGDLEIIIKTINAVIKKEGISAENEATMAPFIGSNRL